MILDQRIGLHCQGKEYVPDHNFVRLVEQRSILLRRCRTCRFVFRKRVRSHSSITELRLKITQVGCLSSIASAVSCHDPSADVGDAGGLPLAISSPTHEDLLTAQHVQPHFTLTLGQPYSVVCHCVTATLMLPAYCGRIVVKEGVSSMGYAHQTQKLRYVAARIDRIERWNSMWGDKSDFKISGL